MDSNVKPRKITDTNISDVNCNTVQIEVYEDHQLNPPLVTYLYLVPDNFVCVYNVNQNSDNQSSSCFQIESEKSKQNKLLMKSKYTYPRVDPVPSQIVDDRTDDQKTASILWCCSQISDSCFGILIVFPAY